MLAAPFVKVEDDRFREQLEVELAAVDDGASIRYSFDPDLDLEEWNSYTAPIELTELREIDEKSSCNLRTHSWNSLKALEVTSLFLILGNDVVDLHFDGLIRRPR